MKSFSEALRDGFTHVTEMTDPEMRKKLTEEGILIDDEGYWSFSFGDKKEYELCIEPFEDEIEGDARFYISLYKNRIRMTERLSVWIKKNENT